MKKTPMALDRIALSSFLLVLLTACGADVAEQAVPDTPPDGIVQLSEAQVRSAGIVTAVVDQQVIQQQARVPGSVQPPDTAQAMVGSFVEGRVVRVLVLPGDVVRAGQPLVEIHTHELADAQRDLRAAEAELRYHSNALQRSEELLEAGAVSLEEVERRRADYEAANAEVLRAEEIVEHLNPSPDGESTVVAPRSGTIFVVDVHLGQAVLPGTPLIEMGSTDVLWVTAFVPEHTATSLMIGDRVAVRFAAPEAEVDARLVTIGNFVDPDNRSVEVRFELLTIPAGVRSGSFAVVDVTTSEAFDGVELDEDAAVRIADEDVVFIVSGPGRYEALTVTAVATRDGKVAVQGVPEGAEIVIEGAYFLKAAMELAAISVEGDEGEGAAP